MFAALGAPEGEAERVLARVGSAGGKARGGGQGGGISFDDFCVALGPLHARSTHALREAFARFDRDGNGSIDRSELRLVLERLQLSGDEAAVDAMMAAADTDGDGAISFDEFCALLDERLLRRRTQR